MVANPLENLQVRVFSLHGLNQPAKDHHLIAVKTCKDLEMGEVGKPGWPNIQGPKDLPLLFRHLSNLLVQRLKGPVCFGPAPPQSKILKKRKPSGDFASHHLK